MNSKLKSTFLESPWNGLYSEIINHEHKLDTTKGICSEHYNQSKAAKNVKDVE